MIPALVLTAGLATRLRPLSFVRAKAALPVGREPLIRRILRDLAAAGVTDAVLNLHHLPHTLTGVVGDGSDLGMRVRYSWEMPVLGSAGGPRHALGLIGARRFLIVNGDTLTNANVAGLVDDHRRSGALVTMAVVPNTQPDRYGGALVDPSGVITGFTKTGAPEASYHVIGLQAVEAEAFATVPDNIPCESTRGLYPELIRSSPGSVRAWRTSADFLDIGTPSDYLATALRVAAQQGVDPNVGRAQVRVDPTAQVIDSVLWDDVEVGAGTMLRESVVTDGVRVPADTSWTGVTIRNSNGELHEGERVVDGLAIGPL